jgi:hypothetical protein
MLKILFVLSKIFAFLAAFSLQPVAAVYDRRASADKSAIASRGGG